MHYFLDLPESGVLYHRHRLMLCAEVCEEIAVLAIVAKRLGVEEFYALFMSIMNRFGKMTLGKDD
mgnify:CR=1 FL=1